MLVGSPAISSERRAEQGAIDLVLVSRIKAEGLTHSHVMDYAHALSDVIGARLTASPQFSRAAEWAAEQLREIQIEPHIEKWGPFGLSWEQIKCSLTLQGDSPAVFVAQATPWSPATAGAITSSLVRVPLLSDAESLKAYHGKLAGKIILYGQNPTNDANDIPGLENLAPERLKQLEMVKLARKDTVAWDAAFERQARFNGEVARFFSDEGALGIIISNGQGKTFIDDNGSTFGYDVYKLGHHQALPSIVMEADGFNRLDYLLKTKHTVRLEMEVGTRTEDQNADGLSVIGDFNGDRGVSAGQAVMVGAHLDSWAAATGATDDGAPVAIELEALRILHAVGYKPRRPLRVAFWGGEEEGELGSRAFVEKHIATTTSHGGAPDLPDDLRPVSAYKRLPGYGSVSAYFNLDSGAGRIIGIGTNGDDAAAAVFKRWLDPLSDLGVTVVSSFGFDNVDSSNFRSVGVPAYDLLQEPRDYSTRTHHTNLDSFPRLSEVDMKQAAIVVAILLYEASEADRPLI